MVCIGHPRRGRRRSLCPLIEIDRMLRASRLSWFAWAFAFARGALKARELSGGHDTAEYLDNVTAICLDKAFRGDPFDGRLSPTRKRTEPPTHLQALRAFHQGLELPVAVFIDLQQRGLVREGKVTSKGRAECALAGVLLLHTKKHPGPVSEEDELEDVPAEKVPSLFQRQLMARGLWQPTPEPERVIYSLMPQTTAEPEPAATPSRAWTRGVGRAMPYKAPPPRKSRAGRPQKPSKSAPPELAETVRRLLAEGCLHTLSNRLPTGKRRLMVELARIFGVSKPTIYRWCLTLPAGTVPEATKVPIE